MPSGKQLNLEKCPHCRRQHPRLDYVYSHSNIFAQWPRADGGKRHSWGVYVCYSCSGHIVVRGQQDRLENGEYGISVEAIFPRPKSVHDSIEGPAAKFLSQALDTLHAPDACVLMCAASIDAMLKEKDLVKGNLHSRIREAVKTHLIPKSLGDWAHQVRLDANRPRHADETNANVTPEEAERAVAFAEAMGQYLFVLPSLIPNVDEADEEDD